MSYNTIISAQQLHDIIDNDNVRVFDCRFSLKDPQGGLNSFQQGHLPNAYFADMDTQLSSAMTEQSGRHPLPPVDTFIQQLKDWGINNETQVIAYDDVSGAFAARLWWMLRWLGHDKVAVLDGGMKQWADAGFALTQAVRECTAGSFSGVANSDWLMDIEDVQKQLAEQGITLIDARSADRFSAKDQATDPVPGHIPGASSLPFAGNLTQAGVFASPEVINQRFATVINDRPLGNVVNMCGSGVTACHNLLAQAVAGMPPMKLFIGSWSQWIRDPARPIAKGDK